MTEHTLNLKIKFKKETGKYADLNLDDYINWLEKKAIKYIEGYTKDGYSPIDKLDTSNPPRN